MATILTITSPIYLLIGLGFLSVRTGYFAGSDVRAIGTFVVRFALPALIFLAVGTAAPSETLHWGLFTAYLSASLALFGACILVGRLVFRARWSMACCVGLIGMRTGCGSRLSPGRFRFCRMRGGTRCLGGSGRAFRRFRCRGGFGTRMRTGGFGCPMTMGTGFMCGLRRCAIT